MGQPFGGGQAAVEVAITAVPLAVLLGAALYLRGQYRRYGQPRGWPGLFTLTALATGIALAAYAVWPLPASVDGLCAGASGPSGDGPHGPEGIAGAADLPSLRESAPVLVLFLLVGMLARHRFRRGLAVTLLTGAALAGAVVGVRATGVLGLYPCAYADASPALAVLGAAATPVGWLVARWAFPSRLGGFARGWPAAVADHAVPGLDRRLTGALLDLGLWWFGATALAAVLHAFGAVDPGTGTRTVALLCLAAVLAVASPHTRRDRVTPGGASVRLALGEHGSPRPASHWRVLARTCLFQGPVTVLVALGLPWYALAVAAAHVSTALVRSDRAGLADLVCGVRVRTRATLDGGLPTRMVRHAVPREDVPVG